MLSWILANANIYIIDYLLSHKIEKEKRGYAMAKNNMKLAGISVFFIALVIVSGKPETQLQFEMSFEVSICTKKTYMCCLVPDRKVQGWSFGCCL